MRLIATAELLSAAVGRWPIVRDWGALGSYVGTDLFLVFSRVTRGAFVRRWYTRAR